MRTRATEKIDRHCCVCGAEEGRVCVVMSGAGTGVVGDRPGDSRLDEKGRHRPHFYR